VIGAQVAVFGVHDSAQKHVAQYAGTGTGDAAIVRSALGLVLLASTALAAVLVAAAGPIGRFASSEDVALGLYLTAPGIVCFALNKVLFGAINGRGALRTYARMQLLRAALVLAAAVVVVVPDWPVFAVGAIFAAAELILLPCLLVVVGVRRRAADAVAGREWWRRHAAFGGLGLINSVLLETHLRVDVLTLSYFASDRAIGIYAFAVLFAEGIYQVPVVLRTVAYPAVGTLTVAVRALATRDLSDTNTWRIVRRELLVGIVNGVGFAVIMGVIAAMWFNVNDLGVVIGLAMITVLAAAALGGIAIPIALDRLGADPAVSSGPFVTTVTDVIGFFAFLGIATLWFGLR